MAKKEKDVWQVLLETGAVVKEIVRKKKGRCVECGQAIDVGERCITFHEATREPQSIKESYVVLDLDCWEEFRKRNRYQPHILEIHRIAKEALQSEELESDET